jgi:hypothetical protein
MKRTPKSWLAFASVILTLAAANATDLVWIGGTGNWNASPNWSPAQIPSAADDVWITNNGTYTVTVPAAFAAAANSVTVGGASGIQTLAIDRTTLTLNSGGLINPNGHMDLLVAQTVLTSAGSLTVNGTLNWLNGTINGSGTTTIGSGGVLIIDGGVTLDASKLINFGTATWEGGALKGANGAAITNMLGATFNNTFDGNMSTGSGTTPVFGNNGLFEKTGGTGAAGATSIDFHFINTGTVEVQTNELRYAINQQTTGLTLIDGSALSAQAQPIQILGGSLVATGAVTVANTMNLINASRLTVGIPLGELDVTGNYQQPSSGILDIDLGGYLPGTDFDLVTVTGGGAGGIATLGGTLNITLANGFFPTNGATFTFLTAVSRVGVFATFNYPSNDIGLTLSYDATSAKVTVSNLRPVVVNPISDPLPVPYGGAFNFQFPVNTFADPDGDVLTYTASGLPPGVTFNSSTRTFSGTPTQTGIFQVTVTANDGGVPSLTATNIFNIAINPAPLTIIAQPQSKTYGAADPILTFTVSGLQFPDTQATVLTGTLTRSTGESVAGRPYAITQGTLIANANYAINFTSSEMTITPAPLSITADAQTKVYGAPDPTFTATYAGFVNGETAAVLGGALMFIRHVCNNVYC